MTVDIVDKYCTNDNNPIKNLRLRAQRHPVLYSLFDSRMRRKTPRRRITVTSSLNEISADQRASGQIIKDDVNGFTSTSDMCFM
jgi:hypothetical protein